MKFIFRVLIVCLVTSFTQIVYADTVYLYDPTGNVAAVIAPGDQSINNVYLASTGEAVGYVDNTNGAVYSYSGNHIGWYSDGVLWDNNGYILAFVETNKPKTITVPLVKKEVVLKTPSTVPVITTQKVVSPPPTYVYEVSPTPINAVFTVEPAK